MTNWHPNSVSKLMKNQNFQVDEASLLLAEYNGRLMAELEERKEVAQMLAAFMKQQLDKVAEAEKRLEVRKVFN